MPSPETRLNQGLALAAAGLGGENVGSKEAINQLVARSFGVNPDQDVQVAKAGIDAIG